MSMIKKAQIKGPRGKRPGVGAPRGGVAGPGQHSNSYTNSNSYYTAPSAIKEMQQAILNFAAKAEATTSTSMKGPEETDPFGNFLVSNYINDSDVVGKQYLNVDVSGDKKRNDASIDNTSLKGIIDTIKRIGSPGSEKAVDGVWQVKTNNSLKNIFAIASAILNMATSFNLALKDLDDAKLEEFKKLIPNNYTDISEGQKVSVAKKLTPLINDIANVFEDFKKYVLQNKQYSKYIEQKKSFIEYKHKPQSATALLNEEDKKFYMSQVSRPVPNVKVDQTDVTLFDLENMQNFKLMMGRAGRDSKNPAEVSRTVSEVAKELGGNTSNIMQDPGF